MTCTACGTDMPDGDAPCPRCGHEPALAAAARQPVEPLLAQANLHRMRGQWHDAEARCVEVLRADPNNVHAHSLLGDILRDQGRYEDAAQWYQMALDLSPSSAADKTKLASVESERARHEAHLASGPASRHRTQVLLGLPPTLWLQGLWVAIAVFVVAVVAILVVRPRPPRPPVMVGGTIRTAPSRPSANPYEPPVVTAPSAGPAGELPGGGAGSAAGAGSSQQAGGAAGPSTSAQEARLQQAAAAVVAQMHQGAGTVALLDGRQQRATLVISLTGQIAPSDAVAVGAAAVEAGFAAVPSMMAASVSVRTPTPDGVSPLFEGEIDRAPALAIQPGATPEELLSAFRTVWLRPGSGT